MQGFCTGLRWKQELDVQTDRDAFKVISKYKSGMFLPRGHSYIWAVKQQAQQLTF